MMYAPIGNWLTSQVPPDRVVITGDSAGGHLSVDLLLQPDVATNGPAMKHVARFVDTSMRDNGIEAISEKAG